MKHIVFCFFLCLSAVGSSQVWIDANAVWNYKIPATQANLNNPGYYEYRYDEDTLIAGQVCQKITSYRIQWFWNGSDWDSGNQIADEPNYTYVSGDTVFYYFNNQFFTLFNFGANIGDQWLIADTSLFSSAQVAMCNDSTFVEVLDTGSIVINSTSYRTITLQTSTDAPYALNGVFVERFGFLPDSSQWRLMPIAQSCDPNFIIQPRFINFSCFHDDSFVLYNPTGEACQNMPSTLAIESNTKQPVNVYPNPVSNVLQIESPKICMAQVFSLNGKALMSFQVNGAEQIDLTQLSNGTYYILFSDGASLREVVPITILR